VYLQSCMKPPAFMAAGLWRFSCGIEPRAPRGCGSDDGRLRVDLARHAQDLDPRSQLHVQARHTVGAAPVDNQSKALSTFRSFELVRVGPII